MDIAAIDYWANCRASFLHRTSPLGKGVAALAFVAAVVLANSPILLLSVYLLLVAGVFASRLPARPLLTMAAYPTLFALLFAASRWSGELTTPAVILLKALTAAQAMVLLITTTPYPDLFAEVNRLLPRLLADGLFVTYRSFFLLLEEMSHVLTALRLRGGLRPGQFVSNARPLSRALGMLLIRAVDLSERLYAVLRVRGYRGQLVAGHRRRSGSRDDLVPLGAGAVVLMLSVLASLRPDLWAPYNGFVLLTAALVAGLTAAVSRRDRDTMKREAAETRRRGDAERGKQGNERRERHEHDDSPRSWLLTHHSKEVARVSCVRHVYPDGTEVSLCGLDFLAHQGERVVILGPNGAGKSTLLNHLLGLLRPTEGKVEVLGHDPAREFGAIQPRLGVLLQNVDEQLLGPTVAEDVAFGARNAGYSASESAAMAERAMERLGVLHLADKVPHYLSGGEKRKVALAGALVTDPELLVLDEPFEGLDPRSRNELVGLLSELHQERDLTLIVTSHHVDLVPVLADTVYVLADGGQIVASGTPQEVFSQSKMMRESAIEPPALTLLFQRLREGGLDLGMPTDLDDAARRLLEAARVGALQKR